MSATHPFKVGDRVRRRASQPNNRGYRVGSDPFEIADIRDEFIVDQYGESHSPKSLELVESASSELPSVEGYNDPARERLLRQIDDLSAVVRRRNEQIATLQEQLKEKQALLDDNPTPLHDLQKRIGEANAAKGFHEEGHLVRKLTGLYADDARRNYATSRLALITTEVAEAIEELRNGRRVDETYYPSETKGLSIPELRKPEGVPSELADVVIRAFDFAHEFGIDLAAIIDEKLRFNATRPHKHGKEF